MRNLGSNKKKCNKKRNRVFVVVSCIMPCGGCGSLPSFSFRGLLKRIRCHIACCHGVVTVIERTDGPQEEEERDMEDGETGGTHSAKNVSQSRPCRWFRWCQTLVARVKGVKPSTTQKWLESQLAYTLHKPAGRRFKRNRVFVNGKDEQWQADLVDVQALKKDNDGYRFLLTVIDVLSKYAWVVPLKDKTGKSLVDAFDTVFKKDARVPEHLQTDAGK